MNNPKDNRQTDRRFLPFIVEFVKFSSAFAVIIVVSLFMLHVVSAAGL